MSADWFKRMRDKYMAFPDHYLVFDVETTGLICGYDLVTQVGWCMVMDRVPIENGATVLDWTRVPEIDQEWLRSRMEQAKRQMEARGKQYHMTYDRMREEGQDPRIVLDVLASMLYEALDRCDPIMGHNSWGFDVPMLRAHFERWGQDFVFPEDNVLDTGSMEKASQLDLFPEPGESLGAFFRRVHKRWSAGVLWSLDRYCTPKYKLIEKHHLDPEKAHDAGFDSLVTHHLFETYRNLAEAKVPVAELIWQRALHSVR
jgi:DNA polymerase III epsilon subunit-like protein